MKENNLHLHASLKMHFDDQLNNMSCATRHLSKNLPEMAKLAASTNLRLAFEEGLEEAKKQLDRINEIYEHFQITSSEESCKGIKGIINEAYSAIKKLKRNLLKET